MAHKISGGALEKVANAIGQKHGLRVSFRGSKAYTTAREITLPAIPEGELTEDMLTLTKGLCDHEVLHHRFTVFAPVLEKINRMPDAVAVHNFTNLIEDVRIEVKGGAEYVGMKENMEKALGTPEWFGGPQKNVLNKLASEARKVLCGYKWENDYRADVVGAFGDDIFARIDACKSTWDALALALALLNRNEDGSKKPKPKLEPEPEPDGGEGEPNKDGKKGDKKQTKKQDKLNHDAENMTDPFADMKKKLDRGAQEARKTGAYLVYDKSQDSVRTVDEESNTNLFKQLRQELKGLNSAATKMANLFLARTESRWVQDREEGKVNVRALAKVPTGKRDVYKAKMVSSDRDTAICLLNDFSGSMTNHRINAAMQSTVMFLECLQLAKIKTEVLGYTTGVNMTNYIDHACARFGRLEALVTYVFKTFDEAYGARVQRRISGYQHLAMRNNCDGDSVRVAADRLLKRKESRKVLIVMTDGLVDNAGDCSVGRNHLKRTVAMCERQGVEVIAVAIGTSKVAEQYYTRVIDVDARANNLAVKILDGLKDVMKIGRRAA